MKKLEDFGKEAETCAIVILSDGETWGKVEGCKITFISEEEHQKLLDGENPKACLSNENLQVSLSKVISEWAITFIMNNINNMINMLPRG